MSELVGSPEDRFSPVAAHIMIKGLPKYQLHFQQAKKIIWQEFGPNGSKFLVFQHTELAAQSEPTGYHIKIKNLLTLDIAYFGFPTRSDTKWSVQSQKRARILKFWV